MLTVKVYPQAGMHHCAPSRGAAAGSKFVFLIHLAARFQIAVRMRAERNGESGVHGADRDEP